MLDIDQFWREGLVDEFSIVVIWWLKSTHSEYTLEGYVHFGRFTVAISDGFFGTYIFSGHVAVTGWSQD